MASSSFFSYYGPNSSAPAGKLRLEMVVEPEEVMLLFMLLLGKQIGARRSLIPAVIACLCSWSSLPNKNW